jgi:hypothetical protein
MPRTNLSQGPVWMTFTPLLGMSDTVGRFILAGCAARHVTSMTIDDAGHYTPKQRDAIAASYPPHEREARLNGVPALGDKTSGEQLAGYRTSRARFPSGRTIRKADRPSVVLRQQSRRAPSQASSRLARADRARAVDHSAPRRSSACRHR